MGDLLEDITGVIYQAFGFYRILPLTALTIKTPPETINLAGSLAQGGSTDANEVIADAEGKPTLKYNPGRIDPTNAALLNSRKPLAAAWVPVNGNTTFFTVNVHWASKGGSSSIHG